MAGTFFQDRRKVTIATLVVAFVLLFAINAFSNAVFRGISLDFTEDSEFTLSPGTRNVLANIDEPITLRLFVSPELIKRVPSYGAAAERVRNLLQRYAQLARGKIKLEFYEPVPFSEDEDRAAAYGVEGVPVGGDSSAKVYFGLVGTNSVDEEEKIVFFHPTRERFIELDLTRLVYSLGGKKKTVGLISSLPIRGTFSLRGGSQPAWAIMEEIEKVFEVKTLSNPDKIPDDIDVLMIVHPARLNDKTLYAIDQYVLKGGRALVMVDPVPESAPRRRTIIGPGPVPPGSDLAKLFKSWGVDYDVAKVATDARRFVRVPTPYQGRTVIAPHIGYLHLRAADINAKDPATANVKNMIVGIPGFFSKAKGVATTVTPLIWTSGVAAENKAQPFRSPRADLVSLYQGYVPGKKPLALAVRVTGSVKTAFPGGLKDDKKDAKKDAKADDKKAAKKDEPAHLEASKKPIDVVIVGDVDLMAENFWARQQTAGQAKILVPFTNNADFVINALDNLSGANALLKLQGRGSPVRPFTKVEELRKASASRLRAKQAELSKKLGEVRKKINETRTKSKDGKTILTEAQQAALRGYLGEFLRIRREQRAVLFELSKDVEALEARMKFYNIGLIPIVIGLIAIVVALIRFRRRRRRHGTA